MNFFHHCKKHQSVFGEFLEAIANPKHEQHDDFVEWAADFDPEVFDAGEATKAMRRGLPGWRQT